MNLTNTKAALERVGKNLRREMRFTLTKQKKKVSGTLWRSIKPEVKETPGSLMLGIEMADYGDYVNKGVQGAKSNAKAPNSPYRFGGSKKSVPPGGIDRWAVKKGIKSIRDKQGRFIPRKSIVFAISRAIYLYGIKPSGFIDDTLEKQKQANLQLIANAIRLDFAASLEK